MTEKQPPVKVVPEPESRLETLLAQWDDVKAQADEWAARLEALKAGIKTELSATGAPVEGPKAFELTSPYLAAPLRLAWAPRWEFDVKALKAADPVTYVTYARKGGRWELRKAAG